MREKCHSRERRATAHSWAICGAVLGVAYCSSTGFATMVFLPDVAPSRFSSLQSIASTWAQLQLDMVEYKTTYKLRR